MAIFKTAAKLLSKVSLAETVSEYIYELAEMGSELKPGQYASIKMAEKLRRPYSIVELDGNLIKFIIDIKPGGPASKYFEATRIGDQVEILYPLGDFFLRENDKPKIFIAAGTGIAPMIPMFKKLESTTPILFEKSYLLWGIRNVSDDYLTKYTPNRNNVVKCISRAEQIELTEYSKKGRVTDVLKQMKFEFPFSNYEYYICGFKDMIIDTSELLKTFGATEIISERY